MDCCLTGLSADLLQKDCVTQLLQSLQDAPADLYTRLPGQYGADQHIMIWHLSTCQVLLLGKRMVLTCTASSAVGAEDVELTHFHVLAHLMWATHLGLSLLSKSPVHDILETCCNPPRPPLFPPISFSQ